MEKKNLVIIGGVVVVSGLALWLYFRKKKPTIMCKDGTPGNNTSTPCLGHGGMMNAQPQTQTPEQPVETGPKTQTQEQVQAQAQAQQLAQAEAHGEIPMGEKVPLSRNDMLIERLGMTRLTRASFAQNYSDPNISGVPEVIIKNG